MKSRHQERNLPWLILLILLAVVGAGLPGAAWGAHYPAGVGCYDCHTLDGDEGAANTSWINAAVRTYPRMLFEGFTPDDATGNRGLDFPCTFCHSSQAANTAMRDALSHFTTPENKHPVGFDYRGAGSDNDNEYLSSFVSATTAGNLQCLGCHDPALLITPAGEGVTAEDHAILAHRTPANAGPSDTVTWNQVTNPYALRDGNPATARNAGNPATSPAEVTEFCTNLCHVNGTGDGILDSGANAHSANTALTTVRGIVATKVDCRDCHAAHYANRDNLIPSTVAEASDCDHCHKSGNYAGEPATGGDGTAYYTGGHGKVRATTVNGGAGDAMAMTCTQCHSDTIPHDFNVENRLPWDEATDLCWTCHDGSSRDHRGSVRCGTCHEPHGDGTGNNLWMIRSSIATPNSGARAVVFTARTGANSFDDGALVAAENSVCSVCHTLAAGTTHNNNSSDGVVHKDLVNYEGQNCVSACHLHSNTPGFLQDCDNCHGYPPNLPPGTVSSQSAGGHAIHSNTPYSYECSACHSGYVHRNFAINVAFDAQNPAAGAYAPAPGVGDTCDNLNCHNPYRVGQPGNPEDTETFNNPNWLESAPTWPPLTGTTNACTFCHTKTSGSHAAHLTYLKDNQPGVANPCAVCHETWATGTNHAKGTLNDTGLVDFPVTAGTVNLSSAIFSNDVAGFSLTCQNVYCHGNYIPGGLNESPIWGDAASGQCGDCHAAVPTSGAHTVHLSGANGPKATCTECHGANAAAGIHLTHVNGVRDVGGNTLAATTLCDNCHGNDPGGAYPNEASRLAKYFWPLAPGSWLASTSQIGNLLVPPNGDTTIAGGMTYCIFCHDATPSVVTTTNVPPLTGVTAPNKATWYATVGHGTTAAYNATLHNQNGPGYDCDQCHTTATAHIDGTADNTDRLRAVSELPAVAYTTTLSELCLDCHKVGGTGGALGDDSLAEVTVHSGGVTGKYITSAAGAYPAYGSAPYNTNPGYQCADCHDAHGTAKLAMLLPSLNGMVGGASNPIAVANFENTDADLTDLDPSIPAAGVCDACHSSAGYAHPDTAHPSNTSHYQGGTGDSCMVCHSHSRSFEGNCTSCHGNDQASPKTIWPDGVANNPNRSAYADSEAGSHAEHIALLVAKEGFNLNLIPDQIAMCAYCHPAVAGGHDVDGGSNQRADVLNDGTTVGTYKRIDGTSDKAGANDVRAVGTYNPAAKTCSGIDCHYEKVTPAYAGLGWDAGDTSDSTCETCHNTAVATYVNGNLPNAHNAHVGDMNYACAQCHINNGTDHSHLDGGIDLLFTGALGEPGVTQGSQAGSDLLVKYGVLAGTYATCSSFYCHGDDTSGTVRVYGGLDTTPTWNMPNDGNCGTCHASFGSAADSGGDATTGAGRPYVQITTGSHAVHFRKYNIGGGGSFQTSIGPQFSPHSGDLTQGGCGKCHNINGAGSNCTTACHTVGAGANLPTGTHVDGKVDFQNQLITVAPLVPPYDASAPVTLAATPACGNCHVAGTADAKNLANWNNASYRLSCLGCHDSADPANSRHNDAGVSAPAKNLTWTSTGHGRTGSFNVTGNSAPGYGCSVCHDQNSEHISHALGEDRLAGGLTRLTACADCHNIEAIPANGTLGYDATVEASNHSTTVTGRYGSNPAYAYSCVVCHDPHGTTNIAMINATITDGMGAAASGVTLAAETGLDPTNAADNGVCDRCHADVGQPHLNTRFPGDHNWGDNCLKCHDHTESFTGSCTHCHGNDQASPKTIWPDGVANNPSRSAYADSEVGSHAEHIALLVAREGFNLNSISDQIAMCSYCHPNPGGANHDQNTAGSPASQADVIGDGYNPGYLFKRIDGTSNRSGAADVSTPGAYNLAAKTCSGVDCHYQAATPAYAGLGWDGADQAGNDATCTTCHTNRAAYALGALPNVHDAHVAPGLFDGNRFLGKGYDCTQCHPDYVTGNVTDHLDGLIDFAFTAALGEPGPTPASQSGSDTQVKYGVLPGTYATCNNFYCHGADLNNGGLDQTPVWNNFATGNCGTCHGINASTTAETHRNTAGWLVTSGDHLLHFTDPSGPRLTDGHTLPGCYQCHNSYTPSAHAASCTDCHPGGTSGAQNPGATYATASHVDGKVDFGNTVQTSFTQSTLGAAIGPPAANNTDRCDNCHSTALIGGNRGAALAKSYWITVDKVPCLNCHNATDPATPDAAGVNVNTAPAKNAYYAVNNGGHGWNAAYTGTGNPGPAYGCTVCHDSASQHITGTLGEDRLPGGLTRLTACADCHNVEGTPANGPVYGRDATVEASNHSTTVNGHYASNPAYNYSCVACHDPHGTSNIAMINTTIADGMGAAASGVTLAAETGLDPTNAADNGVCDRCHADAGQTHAGTVWPGNHNWGQTCIQCHDHKQSFKGSCSGCHGGGTVGTVESNYWPDAGPATADNAASENDIGAHFNHINDLSRRIYGVTAAALLNDPAADARQKHLCKYCHGPNPGADADHAQTLPADLPATNPLKPIWDAANPPLTVDTSAYVTATHTCTTSDCHYNRTTYGWYSGTAATCTSCHNNLTDNGVLTNAWPDVGTASTGDHYAHFTKIPSSVLTDCSACHTGRQPASMAAVVTLASHLDGDRWGDVSMPATYDDKSAGSPLYTPGANPNENNGLCTDVSCHGGQVTPAWLTGNIDTTTVTAVECQKCHARVDGSVNPLGTEYNDARSGAHVDHDHGCQACHSAAPGNHYAGINTPAMDNPTNVGNVLYSLEYTDTTLALVPATNGYFSNTGTSGSCLTVTCHYNVAAVAWDYSTATCGTCHLTAPTSNTHPAHIIAGAAPDHTDCDQCHPSATYQVQATGTHASFVSGTHASTGTLTINMNAGMVQAGTGGATTCALSCHVRDRGLTTWNGTTTPITCNACHYYDLTPTGTENDAVAAGKLTPAHGAHFGTAAALPAAIVCTDCHANNAGDTSNPRTHITSPVGIDAAIITARAVAAAADTRVVVTAGARGSFGDSTPQQCNGACHNPSGTTYSATWNQGATSSCSLCHADTAGDPGTGSHTAHIGYAAGYAPCTSCHVDNGLIYTHLNRTVGFASTLGAIVYGGAPAAPYGAPYGACTTNPCHDTAASDPVWATSPTNCAVCHLDTADRNDYNPTNHVAAEVQGTGQWDSTGHGRTGTAYRSTNVAAGFANCTVNCHTAAVGHNVSTNPFRLTTKGATPVTDFSDAADRQDDDTVCLDCHSAAGAASGSSASHIEENHFGVHHDLQTDGGSFCWDCHDPHGDAGDYMTQALLTEVSDGIYGVPAATRTFTLYDVVTGGYTSADQVNAGFTGLCQTCHDATVAYYNQTTYTDPATHNGANLTRCTICHAHANDFAASCSGCHGGGTVGTVTANYWPDTAPATADNAASTDDIGAHFNHINDLSLRIYGVTAAALLNDPAADARQKHLCKYCHGPSPGGDADHGSTANLPADLPATNPLKPIWDAANPPLTVDTSAYVTATHTCTTSDCHYNRTTYGWYSGTAATCTSCHNNLTDNGVLTNAWPDVGTASTGDHYAHFTKIPSSVLTDCSACHTGRQPASMAAVVTLASHLDGDRWGDVSMPATYDDKSAGSPLYTPGANPNENNGLCTDVSCHGGQVTPAWLTGNIDTTTVTAVECQKCHARVDGSVNPLGTEYNDARSGAHVDHDHGCQACHSAAPGNHYAGINTPAMDNPTNVGNVLYSLEYTDTTLALVPATNGYFSNTGTSGSCLTVTCHYNVAAVAWDYSTATCGTCHLTAPTSNTHPAHIIAGAAPDHTDCDQCHPSATYQVQATGTHASFVSGTHASTGTLTINMNAGMVQAGTGGATTCALSCHVRDRGVTQWDNGPAMGCNSCHYHDLTPTGTENDAVAAGKLTPAHGAHFGTATALPANILCIDCHADNAAQTIYPNRTHITNPVGNDGAIITARAVAAAADTRVVVTAGARGSFGDSTPQQCNGACHNPSGTTYSATWNQGATSSCSLCHAPTTGDPGTGSHTAHIGFAAGYAPCIFCHVDNGTTYTHLNRTIGFNSALGVLTYGGTPAAPYGAPYGACTANPCHVTASNPVWGTSPTDCIVCHGAAADFNDYSGNNHVSSKVSTGAQWTTYGHAKTGVAQACSDCHSTAVGHDPSAGLTGSNPFRLDNSHLGGQEYTAPDAFCSDTSNCHTGAASSAVMSHTDENMTADQRTWPAWNPKCVDCHDPHGDGTNLAMIQTDLFDAGSSAHGVPTTPKTADSVVFTLQGGMADNSYANTTNANGICQECHIGSLSPNAQVSFLDGDTTPLAGNHPTSGLDPCTACHAHSSAFEPSGCESCHGGADGTSVHSGINGGLGDDAPSVTTYWLGSNGTVQDGGHGDPQGCEETGNPCAGQPPPGCTDCHDTSIPQVGIPLKTTHLDGIYQSVWNNSTRNVNTAHLKAAFMGSSSPAYNIQVTFDNYCYTACHSTKGIKNMRHQRDNIPLVNVVEMGTHSTRVDGDATAYPMDCDLNTNANPADTDYAPCISCHDPHGTGTTDRVGATNRMLRNNWKSQSTLCVTCHQ